MRLRARWILPALAAAIVLIPPSASAKSQEPPAQREQEAHHAAKHKAKVKMTRAQLERKVAGLRAEISWHRKMTWRHQDEASVPHTKTSYYERQVVGVGYLAWMVRLWNDRRIEAKKLAARVQKQWDGMSRDFETSVRILASRLGISSVAGWVLSCADSEGGRGVWVFRGHTVLDPSTIYRGHDGLLYSTQGGDVPGGWMQFFASTLYNNIGPAYEFARGRGVRVPAEYRSWFSPVGQALTALWMFHHEGSGQWTGSGC